VSVQCDIRAPEDLGEADFREMWSLFQEVYRGSNAEVFIRDLRAKDRVVRARDEDGLVGFASVKVVEVEGFRVLYSGDVLTAEGARGAASFELFRAWASQVRGKCDWWCLLTSGPRTFRLPFTFFHRVSPAPKVEETEEEIRLRHRFAEHEYGGMYDRTTGLVRLEHPYVVRPGTAPLRESYPLRDWFQRRNPGWEQGDELVSLISLHPYNWSDRAQRLLGTEFA